MNGLETGDTNPSESFNAVLKRLQEWDEKPVDIIARGFALLCQYHDIEILRGRYLMGDLRLKPSCSKVSYFIHTILTRTDFFPCSNRSLKFSVLEEINQYVVLLSRLTDAKIYLKHNFTAL